VTIVEMLPEIGAATGIPVLVAQILIQRLKGYGVKMMTNASVNEITDEDVIVKTKDGEETLKGIDQVIIATGARSVNELSGKLEGRVPEIYTIGDAKEPRTVFEATQEAAEAAGKI
jgi:pyruvate/2-oxoglutarate dehydrogenase complex dihydrolipoamide dehydrogenase (E3) component